MFADLVAFLKKASVLGDLVKALKEAKNDVQQVTALTAIRSLVYHNRTNRISYFLCVWCFLWFLFPFVAAISCLTFSDAVCSADNQQQLLEAGVIPQIIDLLKSTNSAVQDNAIDCLSSCIGNEKVRHGGLALALA